MFDYLSSCVPIRKLFGKWQPIDDHQRMSLSTTADLAFPIQVEKKVRITSGGALPNRKKSSHSPSQNSNRKRPSRLVRAKRSEEIGFLSRAFANASYIELDDDY